MNQDSMVMGRKSYDLMGVILALEFHEAAFDTLQCMSFCHILSLFYYFYFVPQGSTTNRVCQQNISICLVSPMLSQRTIGLIPNFVSTSFYKRGRTSPDSMGWRYFQTPLQSLKRLGSPWKNLARRWYRSYVLVVKYCLMIYSGYDLLLNEPRHERA